MAQPPPNPFFGQQPAVPSFRFGGQQQQSTGFTFGNTSQQQSTFGQNQTPQQPAFKFGSSSTTEVGMGFPSSLMSDADGPSRKRPMFGSGSGGKQSMPAGPFGNTVSSSTAFGPSPGTTSTPFGPSAVKFSFSDGSQPGFGVKPAENQPSSIFGASPAQNQPFAFGSNQQQQNPPPPFGTQPGQQQNAASLFGAQPAQQQNPPPFFGAKPEQQQHAASLFGAKPEQQQNAPPFFGAKPEQQQNTASLFGTRPEQQQKIASMFGAKPEQQQNVASLFGTKLEQQPSVPLFGTKPVQGQTPPALFGAKPEQQQNLPSLFGARPPEQQQSHPPSLFGARPEQAVSSVFGAKPGQPTTTSARFGTSGQSGTAPNAFGSPSGPPTAPSATPAFSFGSKPGSQTIAPSFGFGTKKEDTPAAPPPYPFGAKPESAPKFGFGQPADKPAFGGPVFGMKQAEQTAGKPAFGSSVFGAKKEEPSSGSQPLFGKQEEKPAGPFGKAPGATPLAVLSTFGGPTAQSSAVPFGKPPPFGTTSQISEPAKKPQEADHSEEPEAAPNPFKRLQPPDQPEQKSVLKRLGATGQPQEAPNPFKRTAAASSTSGAPVNPFKKSPTKTALFGKALTGLKGSNVFAKKAEAKKDVSGGMATLFRKPPPTYGGPVGAVDTSRPPPPEYGDLDYSEDSGSSQAVSTTTQPRRRRTSSTGEDISDMKSLQVRNIPPALNERNYLRSLFQPYGNIVRVVNNLVKNVAHIHFDTHESVRLAKKNKDRIFPGNPEIQMYYFKLISPREPEALPGKQQVRPKPMKALASAQAESRSDRFGDQQQDTSGPVTSGNVEKQFVELTSRPATTDGERLKVLDVRDRLLKLHRKKQRTLTKYFVGTCPDMCPERERYLRSAKNLLSLFEKAPPGEEDDPAAFHRYCVKEYSRSSADQEEPLPHDLRPLPTLKKTVLYLLGYVVDSLDCYPDDTPIGEWYNFLWDRTRAIRKDITQQQLKGPMAVDVMEICVRFHLLACAVMAEESRQVFEQKINDENLTKSLTTVLHMYEDGRSENIQYPNEAEFRAYYVLLNANRGDTLRRIQELDPAIRDAPLVQMSVKACKALNSRNYIRFFRLIRDPALPFLAAALLLRYFAQMRSQAIRLLVNALTPNKKSPVKLPLDDLKQWLGFDDEEDTEVVAFCEVHGLVVISDGGTGEAGDDRCVVLDRAALRTPTEAIQTSPTLVMIKKGGQGYSQILLGNKRLEGSLEELLPVPHDSFDENGFLKEEAKFAHDQGCTIEVPLGALEHQAAPAAAIIRAAPQTLFGRDSARESSEDVAARIAREKALESMAKKKQEAQARLAQSLSQHHSEDLLEEVLEENIEYLAASVFNAARQENLEKQLEVTKQKLKEAEDVAAVKVELASNMTASVLAETMTEEMNVIVKACLAEAKEGRKAEALARLVPPLLEEFLDDVVVELTRECVRQEMDVSSCARENLVTLFKAKHEERLARKYVDKWRRRVKVRRLLRNTQAAVLRQKQKSYFITPAERERRRQRPPPTPRPTEKQRREAEMLAKQRQLEQKAREDAAWIPFDVFGRVNFILAERARKIAPKPRTGFRSIPELTFNLSVLLTPAFCSPKMESWAVWLANKFQDYSAIEEETPGKPSEVVLLKSGIVWDETNSNPVSLDACVKIEPLMGEKDPDVSSTTSILLFVEFPFDFEDLKATAFAFAKLLLTKKKRLPGLAVVVTLCGKEAASEEACKIVADVFQLEKLRQASYVADYMVNHTVVRNEFAACNDKLSTAMDWLMDSSPVFLAPDVRMPLQELVDNFLRAHTIRSICQDRAARKKDGLLDHNMNVLVDFYNASLDHVAGCIDNDEIRNLAWPFVDPVDNGARTVPVGQWNSPERLEPLKKALMRLKLPHIESDENTDASWEHVKAAVLNYASELAESRTSAGHQAKMAFMSNMKEILGAARRNFQKLWEEEQKSNVMEPRQRADWRHALNLIYPNFAALPWAVVVHTCIDFMLTSPDPEVDLNSPEMLAVCYRRKLDAFVEPEFWSKLTYARRRSSGASLLNQSLAEVTERVQDATRRKRKLEEEEEQPKQDEKVAKAKKLRLMGAGDFFTKVSAAKLWEADFELRLQRALGEVPVAEDELLDTEAGLKVELLLAKPPKREVLPPPITPFAEYAPRPRIKMRREIFTIRTRSRRDSSLNSSEGTSFSSPMRIPEPTKPQEEAQKEVQTPAPFAGGALGDFKRLLASVKADRTRLETIEAECALEVDESFGMPSGFL